MLGTDIFTIEMLLSILVQVSNHGRGLRVVRKWHEHPGEMAESVERC